MRTFQRPFPAAERRMTALGVTVLGGRLRQVRLRRKLSPVQLAERMVVSRYTLHRLEKGDPAIAPGTELGIQARGGTVWRHESHTDVPAAFEYDPAWLNSSQAFSRLRGHNAVL
jgi:transcriptional regulator with XRE-family HTH domain